MSDELDPNLSRLFAEAGQDLPGTDFQARLTAELKRRHPGEQLLPGLGAPQHSRRAMRLRGIAGIFASTLQTILSGVAHGIAISLGTRRRHVGIMAASGALVMVWLTLTLGY